MKIGIVGGTFNPIHLGHLMLGEYAYREFCLDEIWFMPNGNPPHKLLNKKSISTTDRINMIENAIEDVSYFKLSQHEVSKDTVSYSYRTMNELHALYPENEYYFIIGSDSLLAIEEWRAPELLLKTSIILVAIRESVDNSPVEEKIRFLHEKYDCHIELLPMPILEISSSDIRRRIQENKSTKYVIPDGAFAYIQEHNLYKKE